MFIHFDTNCMYDCSKDLKRTIYIMIYDMNISYVAMQVGQVGTVK